LAEERDDVSLLICGESFWNTLDQNKWSTWIKNALFGAAKKLFLKKKGDEEKDYRPLDLLPHYGIEDRTMAVNEFIPNEDLPKYFQVSDAVLLFYETATPSGIESLSYNFKKPILASRVGHFPETIDDGYNGYLAEAADTDSMKEAMRRAIEAPIPEANIEKATARQSWENYARAVLARKKIFD
jgi:glycosyltransferase involved in cell wall biosynthesis